LGVSFHHIILQVCIAGSDYRPLVVPLLILNRKPTGLRWLIMQGFFS